MFQSKSTVSKGHFIASYMSNVMMSHGSSHQCASIIKVLVMQCMFDKLKNLQYCVWFLLQSIIYTGGGGLVFCYYTCTCFKTMFTPQVPFSLLKVI